MIPRNIDDRLARLFTPEALLEAYAAYKDSKTDYFNGEIRIPMGADGVTYEAFENELVRNAHNISRKVLAGSYLFYPLRETEVRKPDGGKRTLSIAAIRDAIVQKQLYEVLYPIIERLFRRPSVNHVSFAYRKGRSAPQAALYLHSYINDGYRYALDADIVKYFDRIPHHALFEVLGDLIVKDTKTYKLVRRFVRTDRVLLKTYRNKRYRRLYGKEVFRKIKPRRTSRNMGVPQGGVLSGLLANLYLHSFDRWVLEELRLEVDLKYVRYADDFVVLVKDDQLLNVLQYKVAGHLEEFGLQLHTDPRKTRLVDIATDGLDFVGFHFSSKYIAVRHRNIHKFKARFREKLLSDIGWNIQATKPQVRLRQLVQQKLNYKIVGRPEEHCTVCGKPLENRPKSWLGYFSVVTDLHQLRQLDDWIRSVITIHFLHQYAYRIRRRNLRDAGLLSIEAEYYRLRKRRVCECLDLPSP